MQQRFGSDVVVQQGSDASQLGQSEPDPHKLGLVAQEERHGVPLLQVRMRGQSSGHFVAHLVRLAVRVRAFLEQDERLMRLPRCMVQKTIQDAVKRFPLFEFSQTKGYFNGGDRVA